MGIMRWHQRTVLCYVTSSLSLQLLQPYITYHRLALMLSKQTVLCRTVCRVNTFMYQYMYVHAELMQQLPIAYQFSQLITYCQCGVAVY